MRIDILIKSTIMSGAILTLASLGSCSGHAEGDGHDHSHEGDEPLETSEDIHTPGGGALIHLDSVRASRLGIKVTVISPEVFHQALSVGGRLEAAPGQQSTVTARSAGIVHLAGGIAPGMDVKAGQTIASVSGTAMAGGDSNEASQVALRAAKRELDRLTPLHADGIVSTRDYNAALQAYESARAAAGTSGSNAGTTAISPSAGVITSLMVNEGQYVDAGAPIASVSGVSQITLRADLPEKEISFLPSISGAVIRTPYSREARNISELQGRRVSGSSPAGTAGYIPVYFQLHNDGTLAPGTNCEVTLLGAERQDVISVPVESLTEQQGQMFVFVALDGEHYEKRPVIPGAKAGDSTEILSGLTPGEKVVTEGAQFVKLAENAGAAIPGHSHNH